MKVVRSNIFSTFGAKYVNLFGYLITSKHAVVTPVDYNHEAIHEAQMKELLYVPFYILYFINWIVNIPLCWNLHKAYRMICFEKEAYSKQNNLDYLRTRKHYSWRCL